MNEFNFSPLQQHRFDQAQQEYWKEPNCATNRNNPRFQDECAMFATWAARVDAMSEDEFKVVTSQLFQLSQESGDVGGAFYARVLSNLQTLRRSPL